ncbi:MAG TPA: hypothetical protein VEZ40_11145 [Pyrinomonadaceae bacterium]|nr:hypothetical protein [Pyrinomonadaceae bacterium]
MAQLATENKSACAFVHRRPAPVWENRFKSKYPSRSYQTDLRSREAKNILALIDGSMAKSILVVISSGEVRRVPSISGVNRNSLQHYHPADSTLRTQLITGLTGRERNHARMNFNLFEAIQN